MEKEKLVKGRPRKNLTGQRFGILTALRPTEARQAGSVVWECRCDCGNTILVRSGSLTSGNTKSCGCLPGPRTKNLTGMKFGKLTALRPTADRSECGDVIWECRCDCGKLTRVRAHSLLRETTQSCGCLRAERIFQSHGRDLAGQRFGRLTAIRPTKERRCAVVVWECKCDCGNTKLVRGDSLVTGNTKSCGCLRKRINLEDEL